MLASVTGISTGCSSLTAMYVRGVEGDSTVASSITTGSSTMGIISSSSAVASTADSMMFASVVGMKRGSSVATNMSSA